MKKIILLVLDGFGIRDNENGNAIKMSSIPNLNNRSKISISTNLNDAFSSDNPKNIVIILLV